MKSALMGLVCALVFNTIAGSTARAADAAPAPTATPVKSPATDGREDRTSAFSFELLGRGGIYSVDFDHMVNPDMALGVGLAVWSISTTSSSSYASNSVSVLVIPLYMDYFFSSGHGRPYLTAGLDIVTASVSFSDSSSFSGSGAVAVLGGGFEYRGDSGFLFRFAPYVFIGNKAAITVGLGLGYAF